MSLYNVLLDNEVNMFSIYEKIYKNNEHVYYTYPIIYDPSVFNISRNKIADLLIAEGNPFIGKGYVNIHSLPMFQKKIAYGSRGFPWVFNGLKSKVSYKKGICPVAEGLHSNSYLGFELCQFEI